MNTLTRKTIHTLTPTVVAVALALGAPTVYAHGGMTMPSKGMDANVASASVEIESAAQHPGGPSKHAANRMHYGDPSTLGNGGVRAFYHSTAHGIPLALGVEISSGALQNMPTEASDGSWDILDANGNVVQPCCGHEMVLDLPVETKHTPFESIVVNYNPEGHPPPGIYSVPHFDVHFYLFDEAERALIAAPTADERCEITGPDGVQTLQPVNCEVFERATRPLPAPMMPPGFSDLAAVEPSMGNHLIDLSSPEFNNEPFTLTWIYGAWDGELGFFEPMLTVQYLHELEQRDCRDNALPELMPEAGFYPSRYCVSYDTSSDSYRVSLERWQYLLDGDMTAQGKDEPRREETL